MRLKLGGFSDAHRYERLTFDRQAALEAGIREARIEAARRNTSWTEVEEPVRRGPFLVDAAADRLFREHRGYVFPPGSADALTPEVPLSFYVDRDGVVVFLERVTSPATWSDVVRRRVERGQAVAT